MRCTRPSGSYLAQEEFICVCNSCSFVPTTLSLLLSVFDRNGTGTIPAAEFLSFSKVLGEPFTEKERESCVHVCFVRY